MAIVRPAAIGTLILLLSITLRAQSVDPKMSFVIDPNRPYVYLKFDHIGPGIPRSEDEPKTRIWLRLTNNCRVAISVRENGTPDGSPKDERQIMYEVVPTVEPLEVTAQYNDPKQVPSEEPPPGDSERMPRGYMNEVGSSESVPPGGDILFSVPVNHLSKRWHIEIPYTFDLPRGKCCRKPDVGGEPLMVIEYGLWDLPPESLAQIQQK